MADRRIGERRAPEKGVIKLSIKKMILCLVVGVIITISVITNIVLSILYFNTKKELDFYTGSIDQEYTENISQYEVHVDADKEQIAPGETVNFNISIKLDGNNNGGIVMLESLFLYDTECFDCKVNGYTGNNWELKYILNNYFIVSKKDLLPSYQSENVAKVSFTAKKNSKPSEQTISFEQLKLVTENQDKIEFPAQPYSIYIKK